VSRFVRSLNTSGNQSATNVLSLPGRRL
jgi:hypothetical protein